MCIGIIWNNSFLVGGRARAEARIDPRPLRTSRSTAYGAQVVWPLDYMGRAEVEIDRSEKYFVQTVQNTSLYCKHLSRRKEYFHTRKIVNLIREVVKIP